MVVFYTTMPIKEDKCHYNGSTESAYPHPISSMLRFRKLFNASPFSIPF